MSTPAVEPPTQAVSRPRRFQALRAASSLFIPCMGFTDRQSLPVKAPGTRVRRGESLLKEQPETGIMPIAPTDAQIAEVVTVPLSGERNALAIHLEPVTVDSESAIDASHLTFADVTQRFKGVTLPALAEPLRRLAVWADRWTSPDLLAQLRGPHRQPIDTILCNILDEDPAVGLLAAVAAERSADVVAGLLALAAASGAQRVLSVVAYYESEETWEALRSAVAGTSIRLVPLANDYPQPAPTLMIHELTGRHMRWGQLPSEHGVLLLDAAAAAAVGRALAAEEPMLSVPIAVHDYPGKQTSMALAPIGMTVRDLLGQLDLACEGVELRAGCPLREVSLAGDCVISGTELTISIAPPAGKAIPDPCIRCAWCVEGCPVSIRPASLLDAAQQEDVYTAGRLGLDACIECGICGYVCPSYLPLLQGIRVLRKIQSGRRNP